MIIEGQRTTREIPRCEAEHPTIEGVKCRRHADHAEARNEAGELVALDHTCHTPDYTGSIRWR